MIEVKVLRSLLRRMGWDPGFGGNKIAEVLNGEVAAHCLPSVVGVGETDAGALDSVLKRAGVRGRRRTTPYVVVVDGVAYLVGPGVRHHARPIERMDFERFTDSPELRALLYATLWQALDGGRHRVALAIALPVEVLQDEKLARDVERGMSKWLVGKHRFELDGKPASFEIVQIRAKIAQPVATWFDWGLDLQGQWKRGAEAMKAPTLIVDQGFNTLDLLVVEGGRISTRYTSGDTLGMRRAAEMAAGNLRRRYGVELSLHEADDLVQLVVGRKKAQTYVMGELTDVTPAVRQALNSVGADVVRFIEAQVGKGKKFKILLTGGGALALAPRLLTQWKHAEVMTDPVTANARGLAKLAARPGFLGD
jgi:hypothetical protein